MQPKPKHLGDAELEIMQILWQADGPLTSKEVHTALRAKRSWQLSTLMAAMEKLSKAGFIAVDRSTRTNYYAARIREDAYKAYEGRSVLQRIFGSSLDNLVASLYREDALTSEEIDGLKAFLDGLEEEKP